MYPRDGAGNAGVVRAGFIVLTLTSAAAVYRAAGDVGSTAFVAINYGALLLFRCLRAYERAPPGAAEIRELLKRKSYGGFCAVTYLSFAPEDLKSVRLTGGLPPLGKAWTADTVYRACFKQVQQQNEKFYKRYHQDIQVIHEVFLPSDGRLTPKMLQCLGLSGLGSGEGFERLHYLFERVWDPILVPRAKKSISYYFLKEGSSSKWSAHKIGTENKAMEEGRPVYFTGKERRDL